MLPHRSQAECDPDLEDHRPGVSAVRPHGTPLRHKWNSHEEQRNNPEQKPLAFQHHRFLISNSPTEDKD
jgi:hypothetical protein